MIAYVISIYYKDDVYLSSPKDIFFYLLNNHIEYQEILKAYNWSQSANKDDVYATVNVFIKVIRLSLKEEQK